MGLTLKNTNGGNGRLRLSGGTGRMRVYAGGTSIDADAQAFITAAAITDPTQQSAINSLVINLKGYGVWTKMKALYPFVGGTASQHKFNLKNPLDTDAAFRLVFNGGWTHSNTGVVPNGTNAYGDTKLNLLSVLGTGYGAHGSYYRETFSNSQTNIDGASVSGIRFDMGYDNGALSPFLALSSTSSDVSSDTNNTGLIIGTRQSASITKMFRNNTIIINGTQGFISNPNAIYMITARNNNGTIELYSNSKSIAFKFISDGLTDTEVANLYTAVQAFQTTLGRQV